MSTTLTLLFAVATLLSALLLKKKSRHYRSIDERNEQLTLTRKN